MDGRTQHGIEALERLVAAGQWSWDVAEDRLHWSPELSRIYGLEPDEAPDGYAGFLELVHEADRSSTRRTVERALRQGQDAQYIHRIVRADGEVRVLRSAVHVRTDPDGQVIELTGACQDITDETERATRADRLRGLATSGLVAAGLAHDLNNMVGALVMSAGMLARSDTPPSERRAISRRVRELSERVASVTRRIQELSRPREPARNVLDASCLVRTVAETIADALPARVTLRTRLGAVLPVLANRTDLERVLWNLIVNARDALGGGGSIEVATDQVTAERDGETGTYTRITVADDGDGMDEATVTQAFEPFVSSKPGGGNGLGLAVVLEIVDGMGGFVTVETERGVGTQIRVHLPVTSQ